MLASAVEQQRASTQEIAANVHRAAVRTEEVARNIGGVSGAAQVAGDAAGQVLSVAKSLSREAPPCPKPRMT